MHEYKTIVLEIPSCNPSFNRSSFGVQNVQSCTCVYLIDQLPQNVYSEKSTFALCLGIKTDIVVCIE